jgi:hypothetical protein
VRNNIQQQKTYKIGKLVRKRIFDFGQREVISVFRLVTNNGELFCSKETNIDTVESEKKQSAVKGAISLNR